VESGGQRGFYARRHDSRTQYVIREEIRLISFCINVRGRHRQNSGENRTQATEIAVEYEGKSSAYYYTLKQEREKSKLNQRKIKPIGGHSGDHKRRPN